MAARVDVLTSLAASLARGEGGQELRGVTDSEGEGEKRSKLNLKRGSSFWF